MSKNYSVTRLSVSRRHSMFFNCTKRIRCTMCPVSKEFYIIETSRTGILTYYFFLNDGSSNWQRNYSIIASIGSDGKLIKIRTELCDITYTSVPGISYQISQYHLASSKLSSVAVYQQTTVDNLIVKSNKFYLLRHYSSAIVHTDESAKIALCYIKFCKNNCETD